VNGSPRSSTSGVPSPLARVNTLYALFAVAGGVVLAVQPGVNAQLAVWVGDPFRAAFVSFLVGTAALFVVSLLVLKPAPPLARLGEAPWWIWTGGFLGALFVLASIVVAPKLGVAVFLAIAVAGQTVTALVIDHFGWLGFDERAISPGRVLGVLLLVAGVVLVRIF
jgi:transporter family-2 protein